MSYIFPKSLRLKMSFLSVFIPHVFPNISKERIAEAFETNGLGAVDRIDLIAKSDLNGKNYNYAFVHFSHWYDNECATRFLERLEDPTKQTRIVYDDPWYWIVLPNKGTVVQPGSRKPCLDINGLKPSDRLVDTHYVTQLEGEIAKLYLENMALKDMLNAINMEDEEEENVAVVEV